MTKITRATRLDLPDDDRLVALAKKQKRTISQMMRIMIVEKLNDIECRETIRTADHETAQEFLDRLDRRVERKKQEEAPE